MRKISWLMFLISILVFSLQIFGIQIAGADGTGFNVIYPFTNASEETLIQNPYFQQSFLEFLEKNLIWTVIDKDGIPVIYFSEEERFGCEGFCSSLNMNNYMFGSKSLDYSGLTGMKVMDEGMVVGNKGIEQSIDIMNAIRASLNDNSQALAGFERYLLEEQEGFLRATYYDELYEDVWDYAVKDIKNDPALHGSLLNDLKMDNIEGAMEGLEEYLKNNFEINGAFDLANMYSAIENGQLGNIQTEEFMRNVLERIAEMENIDTNLDDVDFEGLSELFNTDEFREMMNRASELMKDNPEMFDKLTDLAREMLKRPETREVFKDALKEMMERGDWETMKNLMDAFSKMENKQELMQMLMEGVGDYMREMMESGRMDELTSLLDDPAINEMMTEAFQSFSQGVLENFWDWVKEIPIEISYVIALIAIIATLAILMKLKL